jgi:hypothetical protein
MPLAMLLILLESVGKSLMRRVAMSWFQNVLTYGREMIKC